MSEIQKIEHTYKSDSDEAPVKEFGISGLNYSVHIKSNDKRDKLFDMVETAMICFERYENGDNE